MILHHSRWKKIWKKNFGKIFFSEFFWFFGHPLENFWFWTVKTLNFCALIWLLVNWNPKVTSRVVFQGGVIMTPPRIHCTYFEPGEGRVKGKVYSFLFHPQDLYSTKLGKKRKFVNLLLFHHYLSTRKLQMLSLYNNKSSKLFPV